MKEKVIVAARSVEREDIISAIQSAPYEVSAINSLAEALACIRKDSYQIAVIDEDFAGSGTGWLFAKSVREQAAYDTKIIMLVRGPYHQYFDPESKQFIHTVDWIKKYPISKEELIKEIERRLNKGK